MHTFLGIDWASITPEGWGVILVLFLIIVTCIGIKYKNDEDSSANSNDDFEYSDNDFESSGDSFEFSGDSFETKKRASRVVGFHKPDERIRYGIEGENRAAGLLRSVLKEGDFFFRNVSFEVNGNPCECDNVIVNKHGVFIIEVKNYRGWLAGSIEDFEWTEYSEFRSGNTYYKQVKNSIQQVKRQERLMSRLLREEDLYATVSGYALLLHRNSPVESQYVLESGVGIDHAIHPPRGTLLRDQELTEILNLIDNLVE